MGNKMNVSYTKLWKLLLDKKMKKTELKEATHISPSTYTKLNNDEYISLEVLSRICSILKCDIGDIMEFVSITDDEV